MKRGLEKDRGDSHATLCMSLNYTLNGQDGKFYVKYVFTMAITKDQKQGQSSLTVSSPDSLKVEGTD